MTDAVVALLVENLNFLFKPEVALAKNLSDDVRFIIDKFKSMQDVLKNADKRSEMEEAVKVWVTQLRHVAFEIEDLLEEYMIQYHKQQSPPVQGHATCTSIHKIKQLFNKYLVRRRRRNLNRQIHNIKVQMENIESAESIMSKSAAAAAESAESIMWDSASAESAPVECSAAVESAPAESIMSKSAAAAAESAESIMWDSASAESAPVECSAAVESAPAESTAESVESSAAESAESIMWKSDSVESAESIMWESALAESAAESVESSAAESAESIMWKSDSVESAESIMWESAPAESSAAESILLNPVMLKSAVELVTEGPSQRVKRRGASRKRFESSMKPTTSTVHDPRNDVLVGIDEPREKLIRWLVDEPTESRLGVVSVFGPSGLGKTTLVKKVYDSEEVKKQFSIHCWITISSGNYNVNHLMQELIMATGKYEERKGLSSELETLSTMQLKQMLSDSYRSKRYIIVMDDMWDLDAWNGVTPALPDSECGSRIIVTTCLHGIATSLCQGKYGYVHELKPLSSEDSWTLFQKIAFKHLNEYSTQRLKKVGQKFLKKCGGLPLTIVALARLLSTKEATEWDRIYRDNDSLFRHSELNDLEKTLSRSYNNLSPHLQLCLLYMCVFPEDYVIKCSRLIRLWVAEGFIGADKLRQEDVVESFLEELIARSLIQGQDIDVSGRVRTCHINGLVHAYIRLNARNESFADFFMNWSPDMKPQTDGVRRLSIFINEDVEQYNLPKGKWFWSQNVRSFFAYGDSSLFNSSTISIFLSGGRIQSLKVLDLEGTHLNEFPGEALSSLSHLKYLGLNSERLSLSSSLGKLVNLETLVLKGSLFFQLPVEIRHLKRLRNLVGDFLQLPKRVGQLTTLEKLCTVVGYEGIAEELGELTQLRSLDILLKKDKNDHIPKSIQKMEHLRSLRLRMSDPKENTLEVGDLTSLPPVLQRITLIGLMRDTPHGILKLTKLTKLRLAFSALQGDSFFEGLQKLSDLCELVLEMNAINVAELHFRHEGFSNLGTLKLHGLTELKRIEVEEGAMPLIRHICFCDCQQLKNVPVGIEHLTTLKHVDWFGMPTELEDKVRSFCWKDGHSPIINVNQLFDKFALAD